MNPNSGLFQFKDEPSKENLYVRHPAKTWTILSVEDDPDYQQSLVASIQQLALPLHVQLNILTASSVYEALQCLNEHKDIGVILLDVVMETDDAGLNLVSVIREQQNNAAIRIVLLTGQPGFAPPKEVMARYDIDEYWSKTDISIDKLQSVLTSNFRTWQYINELSEARQGLHLVVNAARKINNRFDLRSFTNTVLAEIANIIGALDGGLCCISKIEQSPYVANVVCATGSFEYLKSSNISETELEPISLLLPKAIIAKTHIIEEHQSVLYFETNEIEIEITETDALYASLTKAVKPMH